MCVCVCDVKITLPLSTKLTHSFFFFLQAPVINQVAALKYLQRDQGQEKLCYLLGCSHLCFKILPSLKLRLYSHRTHLNSIQSISRSFHAKFSNNTHPIISTKIFLTLC